jgi:YtkA-like
MQRHDFTRMMFSTLLALSLGTACSSSAPEDSTDGTFPTTALANVTSRDGKLAVSAFTSPQQPPSRGVILVKLAVTDGAGKPVNDLVIEMAPDMPSMGHGTPTVPRISSKGDGVYVAENVNLFMAGRWDLRMTVTGAVSDGVVVPVDVR